MLILISQTELVSLNGMSQDSAKLLTEKLALTREIALLKPEIEHLRSQVTHQKDVLAEKLALERQLNSLEVELANEKRTTQRVTQRQEAAAHENNDEVVEELRQQVADLEKRLAAAEKKTATAAKRTKKGQQDAITSNEAELEQLRGRVQELEKQLAAEKEEAQKATKEQEEKDSSAEDELQQRVQQLEEQLASEKGHHEKIQAAYEQQLADLREQRALVDERVAGLKDKLREARHEAKTARAQLAAAAAERNVTTKVPTKAPAEAAAVARTKKKRRAAEMSDDETAGHLALHTPTKADGRPKRPLKKSRGGQDTVPGQKSDFSITPFLNKTINFGETTTEFTVGGLKLVDQQQDKTERTLAFTTKLNSSSASEMVDDSADTGTTAGFLSSGEATTSLTSAAQPVPPVLKTRGRPKKVLGESAGNVNKRPLKTASSSRPKTAISEHTLEKVMEEDDAVVMADEPSTEQENASTAEMTSSSSALTAPTTTTTLPTLNLTKKTSMVSLKSAKSVTSLRTSGASLLDAAVEPKKKKRKLLGGGGGGGAKGTLFDDDGDDAVAAPPAPAPGAAAKRSVKALGKGALNGLKRGAGFGGASFSPLKRDRRGVNASFLA